MIQEIFTELIHEAKDGKVFIDGEEWPIGFNTTILTDGREVVYKNERNLSELIIKDEENFLKTLEDYVNLELAYKRKVPSFIMNKERNTIKWIMAYLFVNATTEDFINPVSYIKRRMAFLNDATFSYLNEPVSLEIGNHFLNSSIKIKNSIHSIAMETPYRIDISLVNSINSKEVSYPLATVTYGICDENGEKVCYVYSLMKPKSKVSTEEESYYDKKVARMLYKLNDGIEKYEVSEYFDYKEGNSKYYPEGNITDVTPSFILSLSVFLSLLQREGIHHLKAIPYLPVRYLSRDIIASEVKEEDTRYQLKLRNDKIQENVTNKFIRTFRRIAFHTPDVEVLSVPYELSEYLELNIKDKEHMISNPILEDVAVAVYQMDDNIRKGFHRNS